MAALTGVATTIAMTATRIEIRSTFGAYEVDARGRPRRRSGHMKLLVVAFAALVVVSGASSSQHATYRIDRVTDGDTVVLQNEQRVRLVQIDSPEKFFGLECYASESTDA